MVRSAATIRPHLVLNHHGEVDDGVLRELLLGIEEEGVPVMIHRCPEPNPVKLAHQAAEESVLTIGIGTGLGFVVVTTSHLDEQHPYLAYRLGETAEADRVIGGNVARLAKRLPLRPVPGQSANSEE